MGGFFVYRYLIYKMSEDFLNHIVWHNPIKAYLLFAGIILLGLILKRFISKILSKIAFKFFERISQNLHGEKFLDLILKPLEFLLTINIFYIAVNQLTYPLNEVIYQRTRIVDKVEKVTTITVIEVIDKLYIFFTIIASFWILSKLVDFIAHVFEHKASLSESKADDQLVPFLKELSKIMVIVIFVFVVLGTVFNLNIATLIAGLGIGGLAIALAAQDTLQNLLGSFTIFADKPFTVGDLVRIQGYEGTIEKVGFRSTLLRTIDKTLVNIPNKKMIDSPLENLTLRNLRRNKFNVGLTYDTSAEQLKKISDEIADYINTFEGTSDDALVTFDSFGDSSLNIQVLYFVEVIDYNESMKIRERINYHIMKIVAENSAVFAFPSQTVYHVNT